MLKTMDLHDPQYQGFFVRYQNISSIAFADYWYKDIPVDNLYSAFSKGPVDTERSTGTDGPF